MNLLVYNDQPTPRLAYACEVAIRRGLACDVQITTDTAHYRAYEGLRLNYSADRDLPGFHIHPSGLLAETGVRSIHCVASKWDDIPILFPSQEGDIPFDLLSAVFYLVSRYEEYGPIERDQFGRFSATQSVAFREKFLDQPVVDIWIKAFYDILRRAGYPIPAWRHSFNFRTTIDVDSAFAYRHKGPLRTIGGVAKDVLRFDFQNLRTRLSCLTGRMEDPYDTYNWFHNLHSRCQTEAIWFFLLADFDRHDKGVPCSSVALSERMRECASKARVGIHPGFAAHDEVNKLVTEIDRFTAILGERPQLSRQHYLRLTFPQTYRDLSALEVVEDHTMGFADHPGFRAGTSRPFPWYDLEAEEQTMLMIYPFAVMDATLRRYLNLTPEAALEKLRRFASTLRQCDGTFTVLWHNESVATTGEWAGWRKVYQSLVEEFSESTAQKNH